MGSANGYSIRQQISDGILSTYLDSELHLCHSHHLRDAPGPVRIVFARGELTVRAKHLAQGQFLLFLSEFQLACMLGLDMGAAACRWLKVKRTKGWPEALSEGD